MAEVIRLGSRDAGHEHAEPGQKRLQNRNADNAARHDPDGGAGKPDEFLAAL